MWKVKYSEFPVDTTTNLLLFEDFEPPKFMIKENSVLMIFAIKKNKIAITSFLHLMIYREPFAKATYYNSNLISYKWFKGDHEFLELTYKMDGSLIVDHEILKNRKLLKIALLNCSDIENRRIILNASKKFKEDVELNFISMNAAKMIRDVKTNDLNFKFSK